MLIKRTKRCETEADFLHPPNSVQSPKETSAFDGELRNFTDLLSNSQKVTNEKSHYTYEQWLNLAENIINKYKENQSKKEEALEELYYFYATEYFSDNEELDGFSSAEKYEFVDNWRKLSFLTGYSGEIYQYLDNIICRISKMIDYNHRHIRNSCFDEDMMQDLFLN